MSRRGIEFGRVCEDKAVLFLKKEGYRILEQNYENQYGEIDIIARDGDCLVFVEVKSRTSPIFGPPYLKITKKKKSNIVKSALAYSIRHASLDSECRVDIVSICLDKEDNQIELIKNAFDIDTSGTGAWQY